MFSPLESSLVDLEWDRIVDSLATYAATLRGRSRCLSLSFYNDKEDAAAELRRVEEWRFLHVRGDSPSLAGISSSVAELSVKTQKEGMLDISELLEVASTMEASNLVARTLQRMADAAPELAGVAAGLVELTDALDAIRYAVDRDRMEIRDRASASLGPARQRVRDLHSKIKRKLDEMLNAPSFKPMLRDDYYTLREDRYVLPVKVNEKSAIKGIVHGSSASGQTVFVEPREMVSINNDLILAQMEVEREEREVLRALSRAIAKEAMMLIGNLDILTRLDVIQAKAALADSLQAYPPELVDEASFHLLDARHPLLVMKGIPVIANDLYIGKDFKALVLSGANTGGKTVAMKTMGLAVLMAWAGMPIPAKQGSIVGRFENIFTVMGDEQSLSDDLSTFSANIRKLNAVLSGCTPQSLVLLDEIVVGTDPRQGAALAQAIVEAMADRGARCVVTTHYDRLKRLAYSRDDFANAAVGLSEETLKPCYKVTIGIPGSSSALRIAEELGVTNKVLERAKELLEGTGDDIDLMVKRLQEDLARQRGELDRLQRTNADLEILKATYERKIKLAESREREAATRQRQEILDEVRSAQNRVRELIRSLQKGGSMREATLAMEQLKEEEAKAEAKMEEATAPVPPPAAAPAEPRKEVAANALKPGTEVFVTNLDQRGVIVAEPDKRGLALVEVGRLKMRIPLDRLRALRSGEKRHEAKEVAQSKSVQMAFIGGGDTEPGGVPISCDLRGERVDEALARTDAFLDRAARHHVPFVYFIHGHGTGSLKKALREHFARSPYVVKFRPGERGEGQDGVTVVFLNEE